MHDNYVVRFLRHIHIYFKYGKFLQGRPIDSEDMRRHLLGEIQWIEEFQRDHQRKPPSLKVLSAMAICKNFKESEEILSLGPSAAIDWSGICDEDCELFGLPTSKPRRARAEARLRFGLIGKLEDWHCGFCRYVQLNMALSHKRCSGN